MRVFILAQVNKQFRRNVMSFTEREKMIIKLSMNLAVVAMNPNKREKANEMVYIYADKHNYKYPDALELSNGIDRYLSEEPK